MLKEAPAQRVIQETFRMLNTGIESAIKDHTPEQLTNALENNAFIFSGFKTYHSLNEIGLKLTDDNGNIKSFEAFSKDVEQINDQYNRNYLYAEYNHAVHTSQMAVKWHDFEQDGDRYNLQYRTAGDDKVRADHAALHDITLPIEDPFWSEFMPPNGWNCRCNVVQVRKTKYEESDSEQAIAAGRNATSEPKQKIFRFNAGKSLELFPPKHPYFKAPEEVEKIVHQSTRDIKTLRDLQSEIREQIEVHTDWFARGIPMLEVTKRADVNGFTNMKGRIALTPERANLCVSGVHKLKKGKDITRDEADAIATLWHEITHNKNVIGFQSMTSKQTSFMELANEFVARKTLPEFYEAFGRDVQHPQFMEDRRTTGYNKMVVNYQNLAKLSKANMDKVVSDVKDHLINEEYRSQESGLVNAIYKNQTIKKSNGKPLTKTEVGKLIKACEYYSEESFKRLFEQVIR